MAERPCSQGFPVATHCPARRSARHCGSRDRSHPLPPTPPHPPPRELAAALDKVHDKVVALHDKALDTKAELLTKLAEGAESKVRGV